jgi:hypothetical protein
MFYNLYNVKYGDCKDNRYRMIMLQTVGNFMSDLIPQVLFPKIDSLMICFNFFECEQFLFLRLRSKIRMVLMPRRGNDIYKNKPGRLNIVTLI